jgi:AAA+ ATPase superfamily predicted ATPase
MPVSGDDFIDRKQHLIRFNTFIENNQHIMINAPRRYGKTSLIVHLFHLYNYKAIYIDIKRTTSLQALAEQIINEVYNYAGIYNIVTKAKNSLTELFRNLRTSLKIDLKVAELTIETLEKNEKQQIDETEFFFSSNKFSRYNSQKTKY